MGKTKKILSLTICLFIICSLFGFTDDEYRILLRYPEKVTEIYMDFEGEIVQWMETEEGDIYRIATKPYETFEGFSGNVVLLTVSKTYSFEKFMDNDIVYIKNAYYDGPFKYESTLGNQVTVPLFRVRQNTIGKLKQEIKEIIDTSNIDFTNMVLVKAGSFIMGDEKGYLEDPNPSVPAHEVIFTYDFLISKYEVTFKEYCVYCGINGIKQECLVNDNLEKRPVVDVSWKDAIKYCNWLSEKAGLNKAYDQNGNFIDKNGNRTNDITKVEGYRLPTEAEWEYAAKGGHTGTGKYMYSGSNDIDEVSWYQGNSKYKTHDIGTKKPNRLGIYDMSGNVNEWCTDLWVDYTIDKRINPVGYNGHDGAFIIRGGDSSLFTSPEYCKITYRNYIPDGEAFPTTGFRIARTK